MATKSDKFSLTVKQKKLAELLANPDFTGSITELCRECGVARSTYYKWLDKPEFTQYVDSLISKFTSSELSTVWKALIRRCSIGDVQAIKLYFEMRRELSSKDESGVQIIDDI